MRTWLPTILYVALILFLALQPSPSLPRIIHVDKYLHAILYGVLVILVFRSLTRSGAPYSAILAVMLTVLVGVADEGVQYVGKVRTADRFDLLADTIGAIVAMIAVMIVRRIAFGKGARDHGNRQQP